MKAQPERLYGLDLARFFAFAGMVLVNFHVVIGDGSGAKWAEIFLLTLEGKAAASFVVLAGVGLGMGYSLASNNFNLTILKRALFLFVIGLINSLIFPADILHYYAIYFVFALLLVGQSSRAIALVALILPIIYVALLMVFDFDAGWNWETYEYAKFWTLTGFIRSLFFNGWHPVIPWLSFLLFGLLLSRLDLSSKRVQKLMIFIGAFLLIVAYGLSSLLQPLLAGEDVFLASTEPVPPMPLYMIAGTGAASLLIGLCLRAYSFNFIRFFKPISITGKQTLTLYIAHIIIGMGIFETLGMISNQTSQMAVFSSLLFIIASIIYANIWKKFFNAGPLEWLLRKVTG